VGGHEANVVTDYILKVHAFSGSFLYIARYSYNLQSINTYFIKSKRKLQVTIHDTSKSRLIPRIHIGRPDQWRIQDGGQERAK